MALTSNISSYSDSVVSTIGLRSTLPTVLTATSMVPIAEVASVNSRAMFAGSVRSPWMTTPFLPASRTAARVSSASPRLASEL